MWWFGPFIVKHRPPIAKGRAGEGRSAGHPLADRPCLGHNGSMKRAEHANLVVGLTVLLACVALNVWVFRFGILYGLVGLNLTKHVGVAVLCQAVGAHQGTPAPSRRRTCFQPAHRALAGPHSLAKDAR